MATTITNDTFGDFQVGWFKQVTLLHSDLIKQVATLDRSLCTQMTHLRVIKLAGFYIVATLSRWLLYISK